MSGQGDSVRSPTSLTSVFTRRLGFNKLADVLPGNIPPLYLYAVTFIFLDFGVVGTYSHLFTERSHAFLINPFSLAIPAFVILSAVGVRYMTINYQQAFQDMRLQERSETDEVNYADFMASFHTRVGIYIAFLAGFYLYLTVFIGLDTYIEEAGVVFISALSMVIYPFGYIPIAVEFFVVFASINFILPKKVSEARPKVAFLDPRDSGGFHVLGELFKRSYYFYTVCLLLYLCHVYGPTLSPTMTAPVPRAGSLETVFFMSAWAFGLLAIGSSIFVTHRLMSSEKETHLRELEEQLNSTVDDEYDILSADLHDNAEYEKAQKRKEEIRSMNEYPTTPGVSKQILFSVVLPQVVQIMLQIPI